MAASWSSVGAASDGWDLDHGFLAELSAAGVLDVAEEIGLDFERYLLPLAGSTGHQYRRYRWSVGYHEEGGSMISAMPPEEEMGWTPWERWHKDADGRVRRESWVLYPLKEPKPGGVARWYKLDETGLEPRYSKPAESLEEQLRRARVFEAAEVLGFDAQQVLIDPLSDEGHSRYRQCRWVVVPHILAADGPVIYVLPPMHLAGEWPWESWYTDGETPLILHVHNTKPTDKTIEASWSEYPGAPQRPPEIMGVEWYWYDEPSFTPTMAKP